MIILAIDPSSRRTGLAVWADGAIVQACAVSPKNTKPANERIEIMVEEIQSYVIEMRPDRVVIEDAGGHVHGRLSGQQLAGYATYGKAVGAIWWAVREICPVELVQPNDWTRGGRKQTRQVLAGSLYPPYKSMPDSGCDISDAICLAHWYGVRCKHGHKLEA